LARPLLIVPALLALSLTPSCSKSTRHSSAELEPDAADDDSEPGAEPESDDEADESGDDEGSDEETDPSSSEMPVARECVPDAPEPEHEPDDPPGNANGGLDPESFARLEADQFGTPELIANTFTLAEGPLWDHCTERLLFTDVEARKVHTVEADGSIGVYYEPTNYANGLAFDNQGRLLLAEMGGGKGGAITRLNRALELELVVDRSPSCGMLNTSDDLTVRSDGTIYFTDPIIAHGGYLALGLTAKPIYRVAPSSEARVPVRESQASLPNGIRLSPDEKTLYVVGYLEGRVRRFDVAEDGSLTEGAPFASGLTTPDSMCVDAAGNVYVGVSRGVQVFRADGSAVTLIPVASNSGTTNCGFGGPEGKTLYITAWASLWRLDDVPVPGSDWAKNRDLPCD
jgi:gluconolactonase